jgi:hypothetical protein
MALIKLKFYKVTGLPSEPEANAIYYVIGDDFAEWYVTDVEGVASPSGNSAMINALIEAANLAPLDGNGKLDPSVIPALKAHEFVVVANQAARLALTVEQVQIGDEAFELDTDKTYKLIASNPTQGASWRLVSDTTPEWATIANKPATFAPSAHTHAIADVTGLQTALNGKISNTENFTLGVENRTQVEFDGDNRQVSIGDVNNNGSGTTIIVDDDTEEISLNALARVNMCATGYRGLTSSSDTPSIMEFPTDKDWGFHFHTGTSTLYLAFNVEGTVFMRSLA